MYTREEYIKMLERDLERINAPIKTAPDDQSNQGGATITSTINGKTTVTQINQKNLGNISVNIGCMDFSKRDPHIPDGAYVNGVRVDEQNQTVLGVDRNNLAMVNGKSIVQSVEEPCAKNNNVTTIFVSNPAPSFEAVVGNNGMMTFFKNGKLIDTSEPQKLDCQRNNIK